MACLQHCSRSQDVGTVVQAGMQPSRLSTVQRVTCLRKLVAFPQLLLAATARADYHKAPRPLDTSAVFRALQHAATGHTGA
jgi:hypothetical protein